MFLAGGGWDTCGCEGRDARPGRLCNITANHADARVGRLCNITANHADARVGRIYGHSTFHAGGRLERVDRSYGEMWRGWHFQTRQVILLLLDTSNPFVHAVFL